MCECFFSFVKGFLYSQPLLNKFEQLGIKVLALEVPKTYPYKAGDGR